MSTRIDNTVRAISLWQILLPLTLALAPLNSAFAKSDLVEKIQDIYSNLKEIHQQHKHDRFCKHRGPASHIPPSNACSKSFETKVHAVKINGNNIYVALKDLDFLSSAYGFDLKDVELEVVLKGNVARTENFHLSFNGIKAFKVGGNRNLADSFTYIKGRNESHGFFKLHQLFLNGSEAFDDLLLRLKKNKGLLKITVHGKNPQMTDAYVTFKGIAYFPCTTPPTSTTTTTIATTTTTQPSSTSTSTTTSTTTTTTTTTSTTTTTTLPPEDMSMYQAHIDSVSPTAARTSSTNMLIAFSALNSDASFWCSLDQANFEKCVSPVSFANLGNGVHQFQVYAVTPRGATGSTASYSWSVDSVPPVVTITNTADLPTLTNHTTLTFLFTSTKAGSTFKCSLDDGASSVCQSPLTMTLLSEGLHTFAVSAIDSVGNVSGSPAKFQWTLDLTPPTVSILSAIPSENPTSSTSKSFTFAADETSNFECSVDQGGFASCQSPLNLTNLSEGNHLLEIRATDLAGNISSVASATWTTDYTAPQIALGLVSPSQGLTNSQKISAEFFVSEPAQSYCQLDQQAPVACSSPFAVGNLADGPHQLVISAVDQAGLQSDPVSLSWTVDATAPLISFGDILPSAASALNVNSISLTILGSENVTLHASVNGSALDSMSNPLQLNNLSEGTYTVEVSGFDDAGNISNVISHTFTVDLTAPVITLNSDGASLSNLDSRNFTFSASEEATFECSLDDAGYEACQSPKAYAGLADGAHTLWVRATDAAGNTSQTSASWTVDTTAPDTITSFAQNKNSVTFTLSSDEANVTFICSLDSQIFSACSSPLTFSDLAVGSHTFTAKAIDAAGNIDPSGAVTNFQVLAPIHTTITSSNPSAALVNQKSMSISFSADQTASGYMCSLDGAALARCSSPVSYSNLTEGAHNFIVKAIDAYGVMDATGASKSWTVDTVAPVVTSFTTTATTNSITVTWSTNEASTAKINYGVGAVLNQSTTEDTTLSTSHTVQLKGLSSNTSYSIQVTGRDAAGNVYTNTTQTVRTSR